MSALRLKSTANTAEMEERIGAAFEVSEHAGEDEDFEVFFEHDRWWVSEPATGKIWSVHDQVGGDAIRGFGFELINEGDED